MPAIIFCYHAKAGRATIHCVELLVKSEGHRQCTCKQQKLDKNQRFRKNLIFCVSLDYRTEVFTLSLILKSFLITLNNSFPALGRGAFEFTTIPSSLINKYLGTVNSCFPE